MWATNINLKFSSTTASKISGKLWFGLLTILDTGSDIGLTIQSFQSLFSSFIYFDGFRERLLTQELKYLCERIMEKASRGNENSGLLIFSRM